MSRSQVLPRGDCQRCSFYQSCSQQGASNLPRPSMLRPCSQRTGWSRKGAGVGSGGAHQVMRLNLAPCGHLLRVTSLPESSAVSQTQRSEVSKWQHGQSPLVTSNSLTSLPSLFIDQSGSSGYPNLSGHQAAITSFLILYLQLKLRSGRLVSVRISSSSIQLIKTQEKNFQKCKDLWDLEWKFYQRCREWWKI